MLLRMRHPPLDPKDPNTEKVVSLYNLLFGMNPMADLLLAMLGLTKGDTGRFRNCYLVRGDRHERDPSFGSPLPPEELAKKELRILVYTRNGGGNREDYQGVTDALQGHPSYITDYDDDFDCTYASYEFRVPEKFKLTADELASLGAEDNVSPRERFINLIEKLDAGREDDPEVQKATAIGKQIIEALDKQLSPPEPPKGT
jgi:hypothetical protein